MSFFPNSFLELFNIGAGESEPYLIYNIKFYKYNKILLKILLRIY
jgi:hypothetical protein